MFLRPLIAMTLFLALASTSTADALSLKGKAKVYSDGDGADLIIVPLEGNQALVKVTGTKSPWDGQVRLHTVEDSGSRGMDIWTNKGGRRYTTVVARSNSWSRSMNYEFYLPELGRDGVDVAFNEKKSEALDPKAVLQEYEAEIKTRAQEPRLLTDAEIARADYAAMLSSLKGAGQAEMAAKLKQATGHAVHLEVDWASFSKMEALQRVQYTALDRIVDGIKEAGADNAKHRAAIAAGVKRVVLRHADKPPAKRVTVSGGTLTVIGDYAGDNGYPSAADISKVLEVVL